MILSKRYGIVGDFRDLGQEELADDGDCNGVKREVSYCALFYRFRAGGRDDGDYNHMKKEIPHCWRFWRSGIGGRDDGDDNDFERDMPNVL
jgi:hypothetical protein